MSLALSREMRRYARVSLSTGMTYKINRTLTWGIRWTPPSAHSCWLPAGSAITGGLPGERGRCGLRVGRDLRWGCST